MTKQASLDDVLEEVQVVVVTKQEIEALLLEATVAGDEATVRIARAALGERNVPGIEPKFEHPVAARDQCVRVIIGARAIASGTCLTS